jgi:hypothetical protein
MAHASGLMQPLEYDEVVRRALTAALNQSRTDA